MHCSTRFKEAIWPRRTPSFGDIPVLSEPAPVPTFLNGGDGEDLIQEGMLGLLSAIRGYDPQKLFFKTFAVLCIRRSIISAVRSGTK